MTASWNTKYGRRRVRHEPPTLEEAFIAAEGMSDDPKERIEIAASLMGLPVEEVQVAAEKLPRRQSLRSATFQRELPGRGVVVESRKPKRVLVRNRA